MEKCKNLLTADFIKVINHIRYVNVKATFLAFTWRGSWCEFTGISLLPRANNFLDHWINFQEIFHIHPRENRIKKKTYPWLGVRLLNFIQISSAVLRIKSSVYSKREITFTVSNVVYYVSLRFLFSRKYNNVQ